MSVSLLIVLLFILGMLCFFLYHFFIQQSLREINNRLAQLQPPPSRRRSNDEIRRERALAHDQLVLLEAGLSTQPRERLSADELENIDRYRSTIKSCIDELKLLGEWVGLPFDFEWTEMLERLPNVNQLYRKSVSETPDIIEGDVTDVVATTSSSQASKRTGKLLN